MVSGFLNRSPSPQADIISGDTRTPEKIKNTTGTSFRMKPARGPQTRFFSNYCSGIPGLANYEMPNEVCEELLAAELGKSRQV